MHTNIKIVLAVLTFSFVTVTARAAHADCTTDLAPLFTNPYCSEMLVTMSTNNQYTGVSYISGNVNDSTGLLTGPATQWFSNYGFSEAAAHQLFLYIFSYGFVVIYDNTSGTYTAWNQGTCSNGFLYYSTSDTMATLTLRPNCPH